MGKIFSFIITTILAFFAILALVVVFLLLLYGGFDIPFLPASLSAFLAAFFDNDIRINALFFWIELLVIVAGAYIVAKIISNNTASMARKTLISNLLKPRGYPAVLKYAEALKKINAAKDVNADQSFDAKNLRQSALFIQLKLLSFERNGGSFSDDMYDDFYRLIEVAGEVARLVRNAPPKENSDSYFVDVLSPLMKNFDEMSSRIRNIMEKIAPRKLKKMNAGK